MIGQSDILVFGSCRVQKLIFPSNFVIDTPFYFTHTIHHVIKNLEIIINNDYNLVPLKEIELISLKKFDLKKSENYKIVIIEHCSQKNIGNNKYTYNLNRFRELIGKIYYMYKLKNSILYQRIDLNLITPDVEIKNMLFKYFEDNRWKISSNQTINCKCLDSELQKFGFMTIIPEGLEEFSGIIELEINLDIFIDESKYNIKIFTGTNYINFEDKILHKNKNNIFKIVVKIDPKNLDKFRIGLSTDTSKKINMFNLKINFFRIKILNYKNNENIDYNEYSKYQYEDILSKKDIINDIKKIQNIFKNAKIVIVPHFYLDIFNTKIVDRRKNIEIVLREIVSETKNTYLFDINEIIRDEFILDVNHFNETGIEYISKELTKYINQLLKDN